MMNLDRTKRYAAVMKVYDLLRETGKRSAKKQGTWMQIWEVDGTYQEQLQQQPRYYNIHLRFQHSRTAGSWPPYQTKALVRDDFSSSKALSCDEAYLNRTWSSTASWNSSSRCRTTCCCWRDCSTGACGSCSSRS